MPHRKKQGKRPGPTQRRGRTGGQSRTWRQWASGAHLPPTGAQRTTKGKGGERRVHVDAAMATGTYGSKKRTGCACITYNYTCLHNRKVVTLTSQSTHHRAQHEAEEHTRAILITITKRTCTNHGILTPITPTRGITTRTQTHTACQTEYSTNRSRVQQHDHTHTMHDHNHTNHQNYNQLSYQHDQPATIVSNTT